MPRSLMPLLLALLGMFLTQQLIVPAFAPLSTELRLGTSQLGLVITLGSVALALASPLWGWALDAIRLCEVLIAGLVLSVIGLAGFAAAVTFGLDETLPPDLSFAFVLVFRCLLVGAGLAVFPSPRSPSRASSRRRATAPAPSAWSVRRRACPP